MAEQGEYKHKQFMARMNYATWMRLRMQFKPLNPDESAKDYFLRLAKFLEGKYIEKGKDQKSLDYITEEILNDTNQKEVKKHE